MEQLLVDAGHVCLVVRALILQCLSRILQLLLQDTDTGSLHDHHLRESLRTGLDTQAKLTDASLVSENEVADMLMMQHHTISQQAISQQAASMILNA